MTESVRGGGPHMSCVCMSANSSPLPRGDVTSTPGGLGGPPFEEATSTPGPGVGGLGSPPIRRGNINPWRRSGGFGGSPHLKGDIHPWRGSGGSSLFKGATSSPSRGDGRWSGALIFSPNLGQNLHPLPRGGYKHSLALGVCWDFPSPNLKPYAQHVYYRGYRIL